MERRTRNGLWVCGLVGLSITTAVLDACSTDAATEALEDGGVDAPVAPSPTSTGQPDSAPSAVDATTADAPAEAATSDGGTDAAPDAPPPYTLASLGSKLVLWLEGDTGLTSLSPGNDAIWKDLSSYGNDAVQENAPRIPEAIDGGNDGGVNGHGVIHFGGSQSLYVMDQASLQWATSDFAVFTVIRHANAAADYGMVYGKWTDSPPYPGFILWASYPYGTTTTYVGRTDTAHELYADAGMNDLQWRLVSVRKTGTKLELRINGAPAAETADVGPYDASAFDAPGKNAQIGGRGTSAQNLKGDIAAMAAVKGTVADAELTEIEGYFKKKYGL